MPKKEHALRLLPKRAAPVSVEGGFVALFAGEDGKVRSFDENGVEVVFGEGGNVDLSEASSMNLVDATAISPDLIDGEWTPITAMTVGEPQYNGLPFIYGDEFEVGPTSFQFNYPGTYLVTASIEAEAGDQVLDIRPVTTLDVSSAQTTNKSSTLASQIFFVVVDTVGEISFEVRQDGSATPVTPTLIYAAATIVGVSRGDEHAGGVKTLFDLSTTVEAPTGYVSQDVPLASATKVDPDAEFTIGATTIDFDSEATYMVMASCEAPDQGQNALVFGPVNGGSFSIGHTGNFTIPPVIQSGTKIYTMFFWRSNPGSTLGFQVSQNGSSDPLDIDVKISLAMVGGRRSYGSTGSDYAYHYFYGERTGAEDDDGGDNLIFANSRQGGNDFYWDKYENQNDERKSLVAQIPGTFLVLIHAYAGDDGQTELVIEDDWETYQKKIELPLPPSPDPAENVWRAFIMTMRMGDEVEVGLSQRGSATPLTIGCNVMIVRLGQESLHKDEAQNILVKPFEFDILYANSPYRLQDYLEDIDNKINGLSDQWIGISNLGTAVMPEIYNYGSYSQFSQNQVDFFEAASGSTWQAQLQITVPAAWNTHFRVLFEDLDIPGNWALIEFTGDLGPYEVYEGPALMSLVASQGTNITVVDDVCTFVEAARYKLTFRSSYNGFS